jgi:hypothetical protein
VNNIRIDERRAGTGVGARLHDREEDDELLERKTERGDVVLEDLRISCSRAQKSI